MGDNIKYYCGDGIIFSEGGWKFDKDVSKVFQTHAEKSIPLYLQNHELVKIVVSYLLNNKKFRKRRLKILDIGCSVGSLEIKLDKYFGKLVKIDAIDKSEFMIKRCHKLDSCMFYCGELDSVGLRGKYDLVVVLYMLQFVKDIEGFVENLKKYVKKDSVLIIADKFNSDRVLCNCLYKQFKKIEYTDEEILGKEKSLKNVQNTIDYSVIDYITRKLKLKNFEKVMQGFQFETFIVYGEDIL